ncbi:carbon-nitrogen hydrolase family protein [Massiliimalia massiliensis]|uniref:carbon-nitrogen hydrolase family protein n=1 Tax=Massiliimalia massiliensis TaxID=1852384 RepID=UPI0009877163|nr:carbon-nitrogen hydrolase family protein [Massiliimalia massiliensis]
MVFKVAILQINAVKKNLVKNTQTVICMMQEAAKLNADILLLPECFITSYTLPITNKEALADNDPSIAAICNAAKSFRIGVVATAFTKGDGKPQNSAFVIDKNGEILMKYSKVHTCDFSAERCLQSGTEFKTCSFDGIKLGVMICYDREYPESARILMLKGAELILVPNDCDTMKPRLQALSTRAYENMVGIAMANPNRENAGCSCAFSPICWDAHGKSIDNTLFMADELSEGLFFADFNMDEIRRYRKEEMMGNTFRKVNAYQKLIDNEIRFPFIRDGQ